MFPLLCFKCGSFFDSKEELIAHVRDNGHGLTVEEMLELRHVMYQVAAELGVLDG
jgi:hypothetical protein